MANGLFSRFLGLPTSLGGYIPKLLTNQIINQAAKMDQPVRFNWANWHMRKDYLRRKCLAEHAPDRLRYVALKKNDILPVEIQEDAQRSLAAMPRDSSIVRIRYRCAVTSRPRGVVYRWRLSRIVWRNLADYNKLSGVQRAIW